MSKRVGVERIEQAVNKVKCVWCLKGIVALDRRDVVNLLRRELAKRDARVRKAINKCSVGNCVNKADLLAAIGRKGTRDE